MYYPPEPKNLATSIFWEMSNWINPNLTGVAISFSFYGITDMGAPKALEKERCWLKLTLKLIF